MMKNLLAPYEQRPWAQTNWILVRLWRVSIPASRTTWGWGDTERFAFQQQRNPTVCHPLRSFFTSFTRAVASGTDTHGSHTC